MIPSITELGGEELEGKVVLLRVDFNIENPKDGFRERRSLPTIEFLLKKKARILLVSHRGRPERQESDPKKAVHTKREAESLKLFLPFLKKKTRIEPLFLNKIPAELPPKQRLMVLENLRLWTGEEENSEEFARRLANLADIYVNDAFAVAHRKHASVVAVTKFLPSYAGLLLAEEIEHLTKVLSPKHRPLVLILGGGKLDTKVGVIKHLHDTVAKVILGSAILNTPEIMDISSHKILVPLDSVNEGEKALDIGPLTMSEIEEVIKKAKSVIWNGPVGFFETPRYRRGSEFVAKTIAHSRVYSVVGGGETTELFTELSLEDKVDFLSTGGGAMLSFLAGEKLPALAALEGASLARKAGGKR